MWAHILIVLLGSLTVTFSLHHHHHHHHHLASNKKIEAVSQFIDEKDKKIGVIIVDHGSRLLEANERLDNLVAKYKSISNLSVVEPAHMELCEPSIATAYDECVKQGATHIICYPLFLSPGRHVKEDIPALLNEASLKHPGIIHTITEPLGMHEKVIYLIDDSVHGCMNSGDFKTDL